jgi:hypothetical protein
MECDGKLDALVFDLVEWVAKEPRRYNDVMEAWRTSCPRLSVWEEAVDRGLLVRQRGPEAGRRFLAAGMATGPVGQ